MLPFSCFKGSSVALFGLGASGISAALALEAGGAHPVCWDDNSQSVEKAVAKGLTVRDLRQEDWSRFVSFVLSPGAPLTHPEPHWSVDFARAKGVEIIGDIELFARERRIQAPMAPFIAITGTNGKSTTTALIAHILKQAGCSVEMGGNIGRPVGDFSSLSSRTYYVIECSSFQIDLAPSLDPTVGILLNLTPDHLDRHGSMEHYASVKERLVSAAHTAVIGIDDDYCSEIFVRLRGLSDDVVSICSSLSEKDGYSVEGESLIYRQAGQSSYIASLRHVFRLSGQHNRQNALAAVAACIRMDISRQNIQSGLESFPGLPHRMETIGRKGRVLFVNDSKATNADSSAAALSTFDPVYWILGGLPKAGGIESLCSFFPRIAKAYLIGEAAPLFSKTLDGQFPLKYQEPCLLRYKEPQSRHLWILQKIQLFFFPLPVLVLINLIISKLEEKPFFTLLVGWMGLSFLLIGWPAYDH